MKRLISGFKRQNRRTIQRHLDTLANDPTVYSEHLMGIGPQLNNTNIYIYIDHCCLVLVCLDKCVHEDELADEESFGGEKPLYFTATSHRISPVWRLTETLHLLRQKLEAARISLHMRGVLLTGCTFINADDIRPEWEERGITVIDDLEGLADWTIGVNKDESHLDGTMVMDAIKDLVKRPEDVEEEEEFARLLDKYFNEDFNPSQDNDDDNDDDDDDEEPATADEIAEEPLENDDTNLCLPSGYIDQNNNVTVKVEILHPIANPRAELDKLVGCQDIKKRIDELLALTRYNAMVRKAFPAAKLHEVSLHSIFFGRPGTGKTTVCKIFGSLLHEAGVLSKGHVVVAERSTFLGTLWGDEERSVRQVLEMARGGVLMIDEAYLLHSCNERDPGRMILQLLMQALADESHRDFAVVLCGYKEPMLKMIDSNPGLHSRFPNRFEFNDFTVEELMEITRRRIGEYQYHFTHQALHKYRSQLAAAYEVRDPQTWGNARFVANQLERIFIQHAQRCVKESPANGQRLLTLTQADIIPIEVPRSKPRIGF